MSGSRTAADIEVAELNEHEAAELFDRICLREMHISGAEFLKGWDAGLYLDVEPDEFTGLADVILAVPLVRET
ncbi:MAG: hypothetical protein ACRDSM_10745 [Pseudonocardiaceae bacterium]